MPEVLRSPWAVLAAGALTPLAFAPFGLWPLMVVTLAVLARACAGVGARRAAWLGWLWGLGLFGAGASWVAVSIHQFGLPVLAFSAAVTAGFVAIEALAPALAAAAATRLGGALGAAGRGAVWAATWTGVEWLRGSFATGFPWLEAGYAAIDSPLAGLAPVLGVHGVTLAVAMQALGVAALIDAPRRWPAAVVVVAVPLALGWVLAGQSWTRATGPELEVAVVQANVPQSEKWLPANRPAVIARYRALTAAHWGTPLVVWPETAIPAFADEEAALLAELDAAGRARGTALAVGVPVRDRDGRYYNSVLALGAGASGEYRKRHLVPFGEYIPWRDTLGGLLSFLTIPMSQFAPGEPDRALVTLQGHPVGVTICYEDAFPALTRSALPAAAWLVNVSNDAWFGDSLAPHQHLQMARMRALEAGRDLVRATNTGISAVVGADGRVRARAPQFATTVLTGAIAPRQGLTPYGRLGDAPVLGLAMACLALGLARRAPLTWGRRSGARARV